ncbi:MAG: CHAT domain-containing protein [Acidobacteriota bacterium]|nr:CHAT domain-containing protein [Acidobacteriota bacterium]
MYPPTTLSALSFPFPRSFARPLSALLCLLCGLLPSPLVWAQTGTGAPAAAQSEAEPRRLKVGGPVERELAGGQQHAYQITLTAGQYLNVVVEQRGIDVVVTLLGPDGKKLIEVDSPNGMQGPEPLKWIVETAGIYRIEVRSLENAAKPGRYEAKIVELRAVIDRDRDLAEADKLYNESVSLGGKGRFGQAIPLAERALALREKALGAEHSDTANSLNYLANLYDAKGDYAQAEPLYRRALAIREKTLGAEHPDTATSLGFLANLYKAKGDYAQAEPLSRRALTISEKTLGAEHPDTATWLTNLAALYLSKGDYAKAEPLFQRALTINEKALGVEHPNTAISLNSLATLYDRKGDVAQAIAFQSRASAIEERNLALNTRTGSERQKMAYLATLADGSDHTVSLHARSAPNNAAARDLALTVILQRKGRALDAMTDSIAALRRRTSPQDQVLLDQLQDAQSQLARLVLNGPQKTTPAEHQTRIKTAAEEVEKLEAEVSRRSAEFRAQAQPVTIAAVQAALPSAAALAEFFSYRTPLNPKDRRQRSRRYIAYVLRRQGEAQWVELGEAKAIDEAIEKLRQALRDKQRKDVKQLARAVDEKVMQPVRALLGQTRRVFISPDGALNLIPFAALVDERNRYLIQRYSFSYLTSGRDLLRLQVKQPSKQTALVVANPDFGEEAKGGAAQQRLLVYRPGTKAATGEGAVLSGYYFPPLQGTAGEARALKAMMKDATVLTQAQATEAALKQVSGPRILHIATHGFFLENQQPSSGPSGGEDRLLRPMSGQEPVIGQIENPLLRSGLALAGANRQTSGEGDDGILTAQEAAGLDLWGTKLVVLSACDTGVGEVKNGEGVYGLRRALVLAGSETQVMSLWPVSDKATRDLMIEYYRRLLKGEGRSAALRQVQLQMLRGSSFAANEQDRQIVHQSQPGKYPILSQPNGKRPGEKSTPKNYSHPYYWASFIQSGEWANLDGKR